MGEWVAEGAGRSGARVWRGVGVHRKVGDPAEIAAEAARLGWLADHGIPCPQIVEQDTGVLITTTVPGGPATPSGMADLLRALHAIPIEQCPFDRRLDVTIAEAERNAGNGAVDLDDLDGERTGWTVRDLLDELHRTRPADEDLVVCHGDPTPSNLLGAGMIDVGRLGVADRHNDLAIAGRGLTGSQARELFDRYGLPEPDPTKLAFYRLLDEFF